MSDIITERSGNILSIQLNRPAKKKRNDLEHVHHDSGNYSIGGKKTIRYASVLYMLEVIAFFFAGDSVVLRIVSRALP